MKNIGMVLMVAGVFLVLSALGQDDYETHASVHNRAVEAMPFWVLAGKMISGATLLYTGYGMSKRRWSDG